MDKQSTKLKQYRENYLCLKQSFEQLQESYRELQFELRKQAGVTQNRCDQYESKLRHMEDVLQREKVASRTARESQLTQEKLQMIKLQIAHDLKEEYEARIEKAHAATAMARDESQSLRQEVHRLSAELQHEKAEGQAVIEQNRILYQSEVSNLRKLKEQLSDRLHRLTEEECGKFKHMESENAQLGAKCVFLMKELEDLRNKTNTEREALKHENQELKSRFSAISLNAKEVESERDSLKNQLRYLRSEFEQVQTDLSRERQKAFDAVRASNESRNHLNQLSERTRTELAELRLEAQHQRKEIEIQRDELVHKCQNLEQELELMNSKCRQLELTANNTALEAAEREQKLRDQLNEKITKLEAHAGELTKRLAIENKEVDKTTPNKMETGNESELRDQIRILNERLLRAESRNAKMAEEFKRMIVQTGDEHMQPTGQYGDQANAALFKLQKEKQDVEKQLQSVRSNLQRYMESASKKKRTLQKRLEAKQQQIQQKEVEIEKLKAENEMLRANVPLEEYNRIRKALNDLRKRHDTYEDIILGPAPFLYLTRDVSAPVTARTNVTGIQSEHIQTQLEPQSI